MRFGLLGPLALLADAEDGAGVADVDLGPPKQRAVLAMLLLHRGRVVSVDRIAEAVWGEDLPPNPAASLHAYVSKLRRVVREAVTGAEGASAVKRHAHGYVLDLPPDRVDLVEFHDLARDARRALAAEDWAAALETAEHALLLWRGELLEDFADEDWVQVEVPPLAELRAECHETAVTAMLALDRLAPALAELYRLREAHPLRERACCLQALAMHRAGRTSEALDVLRDHARLLDEELGLEPGAELRELQTAVLRQDPALTTWPRTGAAAARAAAPVVVPAPADPEPPVETAAPSASTLVGRHHEVAAMRRALDPVASGTTRWVVLTGPAGIGKTRLAEECGRLVAGGAGGVREVWARCPEDEGVPAWWPVRQLVRGVGGDPDVLLRPPEDADSDEARFLLYDRVRRLLEDAAAEGPLLAVVDDVQWSDPTSLRCLAYLAGALHDAAVGFVLTVRDGEVAAEVLRPLLAAVARTSANRQVAVGPLVVEEVAELAADVAGAPLGVDDVELLTRRTGGNPLFVAEYARLAPEVRSGGDIPLAVRSVLGRRIAGLDRDVLAVVEAAAVLGDIVDLELVAALMDADLDEVADRADAAADDHILTALPGTADYGFAHGLLREQVLTELPAARRRRLHLRAAGAAARRGDLSRRAGHLLAALPLADPAEVLDACLAAAQDATERWSSETAAEWYAAALRAHDLLDQAGRGAAAVDRDDLQVAHVEALARAGRGQTVLDTVEAGLLDAVRAGRTSAAGRLAAALLRAAGAWPYVTYGVAPGPVLERLAAVEPYVAGDPAAHARVLAALAVGSCYDPDPTVPDGLSRRALAIAEELGDPEVVADAVLGRVYTYVGASSHAEEAVELLGRLDRLPHRQAQLDGVLGHAMLTMAAFTLGDVEGAERHARQAIAGSDLLRLLVIRVQMRWISGALAQWRGDFGAAEEIYRAAAQVHVETELHDAGTTAFARQTLLWERGALADLRDAPPVEPLVWGAAVALARGDLADAERSVRAWLSGSPYTPEVWTTLGHVTLAAHVVADLGLADEAQALLDWLRGHADRIAVLGVVGSVGPVALAVGRLEALLGRQAAARASYLQARELAVRTGGVPAAAKVEAALARLDRTAC